MASVSLLTKKQIDAMFLRFATVDPEPKGELVAPNDFTFLLSVVLSAQATDASVNRTTPALFDIADTPEKIVALGEENLAMAIKTIGLYRSKAKNIMALSQVMIERFGSAVPRCRTDLESLPGVGRKTASVVLNQIYHEPLIAVDTHVFRVSNRTGLAPGKSPDDVADKLEIVVPEKAKPHAHHWLILLGRYVCKARKPECWRCIQADICKFKPKNASPP